MDLRTKLIAAIPPIAFVFDIILYRYQKTIYDQFYKWWFHLSELKIPVVVQRAVEASLTFDRRLSGERLFSLRSVLVGVLITFVVTMFDFFLKFHEEELTLGLLSGALLFVLINLPVGLASFFVTRLLLRILRLAGSLSLAVAIALAAGMAIQVVVLAFWFFAGVLSVTLFKSAYAHGVSVDSAVSELAFWCTFAIGYNVQLLYLALLPLYLFVGFAALLIIIHAVGKICLFVKNFLAWQVEAPQFAAFTVISLAVSAILQLALLASETVPVRWLSTRIAKAHEAALFHAGINGMTAAWPAFVVERQKDPGLASFGDQVAAGLLAFANNIPAAKLEYQITPNLIIKQIFTSSHEHDSVEPRRVIAPSPTPTKPE